MPKTRLNNRTRDMIGNWMVETKIDRNEGQEKLLTLLNDILYTINPILRRKYPEKDMVVLRKYKLIRKDLCLKFQADVKGSPFIFGINFREFSQFRDYAEESIVDIPYQSGCNSNEIFEGTEYLCNAIDIFKEYNQELITQAKNKARKYRSFVYCCKYLEDVEATITLPEDLREKITGKSTALAIINDELINEIKKDFANGSK